MLMASTLQDRSLGQELSPADDGDHAVDGAFIFRDNKLVNATVNATNMITDNEPSCTSREMAELATQAERETRREGGYGDGPGVIDVGDQLEVMCGPLLNYKGMSNTTTSATMWHGSVLVVTKPGQRLPPELTLRHLGPQSRDTSGAQDLPNGAINHHRDLRRGQDPQPVQDRHVHGVKLYEDPVKAFWHFALYLPLQSYEARWTYSIANMRYLSGAIARTSYSHTFVVPSTSQSMHIMFHSCNGFSIGTDEDAWSGLALWNDVLRSHERKPFHVMIGGGDQIYNDGVRVDGPLKAWTTIGNPRKRRDYPFDEELRTACDLYYFKHYVEWYNTEPFASANGIIPQVNIWDDHDIIDGFGSYTDHFMKCAVFRGIGSVSFKYYCLFQHHIPPPKSTYTTSAPQTTESQGIDGTGADPAQLSDAFVFKQQSADPCFIIGDAPGPYVAQKSHSLFMRLGARLAFVGIDARTERTRHQVNYPETYDLIFQRVRSELSSAAAGPSKITHLIVLLGVPIAYPRLIWLENIFRSPIIGPIRFFSKRFGIAGDLFNKFDGQVDLLDDLDDHYTARQHKHERKQLILSLQALAEEYNVRVTILGGDVHLAALGRFYTKPKLGVPVEQDHRYMANVISSAITNHPPPKAVADLLARRNKIHHLDHHTDETLLKIFNKDPGTSTKTANFNKVTMPSRNYAILSESNDTSNVSAVNGVSYPNGHATNGTQPADQAQANSTKEPGKTNDGHSPLHFGEENAGTQHPAASGIYEGDGKGGLDVCFKIEIDGHDREGRTQGYGFSIPALKITKAKVHGT